MEENLDHHEPVLTKVLLPVIDLLVAFFPDILIHQILWHLALMDQVIIDTPHVIVVFFLRSRLLEGNHLHTARIQTCKDMIDRTVLAGRIHRLEHDHEPVCILRVQFLLQIFELFDHLREIQILHLRLVYRNIALRAVFLPIDLFAFLDHVTGNVYLAVLDFISQRKSPLSEFIPTNAYIYYNS